VLFIVRKEIFQVLRDRIMLVQIFVPPLIQLLIVAQAMTFEVKNTDLAIIDLDQSTASEQLIEDVLASRRFTVIQTTADGHRTDQALLTRTVSAVLRIPNGFHHDLTRGRPASLQVVMNAEDGAAAGIIQTYLSQIVGGFSADQRPPTTMRAAGPTRQVAIQTRTLYNPEGEYLPYMSIGLLAALVTLVSVLITSQNIAREREIGTLEQLNVTPITKSEFIAGKLLPFLGLGFVELTLGLMIIRWGFGVAFEGSLLVVYAGAFAYLLAALGLGLLISTLVATQQQAQFISFFALVTMFFLGGIFTPIQSMPGWAQQIATANPIMHFVDVLRTVLMKGGGWGDVWGAMIAMLVFATIVLTLALLRYRKTTS
jgi:ABC-2 type transport system permease protein